MEQKIKALREQMEARLSQIDSKDKLSAFWQDFLGKKGSIAELMKGLGAVSKEERPTVGKIINEFKTLAEEKYRDVSEKMEQMELAARNRSEQVDITLPGKKQSLGGLPPLTIIRNELINVFAGMGFEVFEGPEIDSDYYCFQALNIPKDHPARDMQDTFYFTDNILLRPHTSPGQVRTMENKKPPIKILSPGRV